MSFKLDVAAAEKFLTSLPLFSLEKDESLRGIILQQSKSLDHVHDTVSSKALGLPHSDEQNVKTSESWASTDAPIPRMPLDVLSAELFLKSLTVAAGEPDLSQEFHGVAGNVPSPCECPNSKLNRIVIGGWRSQADLWRLVPVLIKKGIVGGRVGITTRQTCTYISSTRLATDMHANTTSPELPEVKLPLIFPLSKRRYLCCSRRSANMVQVRGTSYAQFLVPSVGGTPGLVNSLFCRCS